MKAKPGWGAPQPVPSARAQSYVESGFWDDRSLHQGIETAAGTRPEGIALGDDHRNLNWSGLAALIGAGLHRLAERGIGSGDGVLIIGGNTVEAVVAYHSVLRAGAIAVLLDRRCGPSDVRVALESVPVSAVIVAAGEAERLRPTFADIPVVGLEDLAAPFGPGAGPADWVEPDRNVPALVLFTSGTTSRPKGVTHSLNTITSGARHMAISTGADETSVIYLVSPVASITGVIQMHLAADCHATLMLDDSFDPEVSLDRINRCQATLLGGAPVIVERLIAVADARGDEKISLRTLALGGTLLPRAFLERISAQYGIDVIRIYGSSEAPNATGRFPDEDRDRPLADDGTLMPGTEVRVGSSAHPQEGLLRGPGVFLGYLDDLQNDESFEGDWYRSGDLIEVSGSRLTVVGRLKEIVNRNGFKISLNEIDAALLGQPGVEECASFGMPDRTTGEHLAVAVVPAEGAHVTLQTVLAHLRAAGVATRKLPEEVVIWDEPLPRTASGKVIRSSLTMDAPVKRSMSVDRLPSR
jgi:acyl-CoA synthetase (AMP-forming)/AMP-acid ligase II